MKELGDDWSAGVSLRWMLKPGQDLVNAGPCFEKRDRVGCWYGRLHLVGTSNVGTEIRFQRTFNVDF